MGDKHNLVIDTSMWMKDIDEIDKLSNNYQILIPYTVLEELDNHKDNYSSYQKSYVARKAIKFINSNFDKIKFIECDDNILKNDNKIVDIAKKYNATIYTNDICMKVKCKNLGLEVLESEDYNNEVYTGVKYLELDMYDDTDLNKIYNNKDSNLKLFNNQYLVIKDKDKPIYSNKTIVDYEIVDKFKKSTEGLHRITRVKNIENKYCGKIKPKNIEQQLLMDGLNSNSTVVCAIGNFGTGKTYLCLNYALEQLEKGKIDKIVHVPNNSQTKDSRELGILPGNIYDKELPYLSVYLDYLGRVEELKHYIDMGQIEIMPLAVARGRNIENAIIFVNEAENLTEYHAKLLLGRVGKGTKIIFDGDLKQVDSNKFKKDSGLKLITNLRFNKEYSQYFSIVKLNQIERSITAQMSEWLEEYTKK